MNTRDSQTPPKFSVTLQDIADHCGVALSTVSLALRGRPNVTPKMRARVLAVAKELGYDPNQYAMARRLAMKKHGASPLNQVIALFFPSGAFRMPYFAEIYHGIMAAAQDEHFDVLTVDIRRFVESGTPHSLSPIIRRGEIDGAIICRVTPIEPLISMLREQPGFGSRPICIPFQAYPGCSSIYSDNTQGIFQATDHLLSLGHRHICLLAFDDVANISTTTERRLSGAIAAYHAHGLDPTGLLHPLKTPLAWYNPVTIPHKRQLFTADEARVQESWALFHQFLTAHSSITAVMGTNDAAAMHAWYACNAIGLSVPEDISIIGYDNTHVMPGPLGENLLTTVHVPLFDIGLKTAQTLFYMIQHPDEMLESFTLPTSLVIRASTAPPQIISR